MCSISATCVVADADGDGVGDETDLCPATSPGNVVDASGCSDLQVDKDGDGICNGGAPSAGPSACSGSDNCIGTANADQADTDSDGVGNACDNCRAVANQYQEDADNDGRGDACDNCPSVSNADQADSNSDGTGNACELSTAGTCSGSLTNCADVCVDQNTDPNNCGVCGVSCSAGEECAAGACTKIPESCTNGIDDDADSDIDCADAECSSAPTCLPEPQCTPGNVEDCATGESGVCAAGSRLCQADSQWGSCSRVQEPSEEQCDSLDNNCDGQIDEEATPLCSGGLICYGGSCGAAGGDDDSDGITNVADECAYTAAGALVDTQGCSAVQVDTDGDGICNPDAASVGPSGCTGSDNCPTTANAAQTDTDGDLQGDACDSTPGVSVTGGEAGPTTGGGGGGGGGGGCRSDWRCGTWNICNATLQQERSCTDTNRCFQRPKTEVQACQPCLESWVCSEWSACQNGQNVRSCIDQNACRTTQLKPAEQKSCQVAAAPGPQPVQVVRELKPQLPTAPPAELSFWEKYGVPLLIGAISIVALVIILLLAYHFFLRPKKATNFDELVEWIKTERLLGTSEDVMRQTLKEHTKWAGSEVDEAFKRLLAPQQRFSPAAGK